MKRTREAQATHPQVLSTRPPRSLDPALGLCKVWRHACHALCIEALKIKLLKSISSVTYLPLFVLIGSTLENALKFK